MPRNLDLSLLRTFSMIAELGVFSKAAERLHFTQSAVSLQIKRLEEQFGRPLFERARRNNQLTEDGRVLLAYANRLLGINDDVVKHLIAPQIFGVVKIGVVEEFAVLRDLSRILERFIQAHEQVRLEICIDLTRHLLQDLLDESLHLAIGVRTRNDRGMADGDAFLRREHLLWVARDDFQIDEGAPLPLVVSPTPCIHRKAMLDALDRAQRSWCIVCHAPTAAAVISVVLSGMGICALSESMLVADLRVLTSCDGLPPLPDSEFVLYQAEMDLPQEAVALADVLVQYYGSQAPRGANRGVRPHIARAR